MHSYVLRSIFLTVMLLTSLFSARAQFMPEVPENILRGLTGYTASYISGGEFAGDILLVGGVRSGVYQNDIQIYDVSTKTLELPDAGVLSLGAPRAFHTATTLSDGRILFFGGESASGVYVDIAEVFDPVSLSVVPLPLTGTDIPVPARKRHAASFFYIFGEQDQYVLISGGCTATCSGLSDRLKSTIIYSVRDKTFMAGPLMKEPRQDHRAVYLPAASDKGVVMQMGGGAAQPEHFDIKSFTKTPGSGQFVQDATTAALVENNSILLGTASAMAPIFSQVPEATAALLSEDEKKESESMSAKQALEDQLRGLEAIEKKVAHLRLPEKITTVRASDTRGNSETSGAGFRLGSDASTRTGSASVGAAVSSALIAAQQEKLASLLGNRFSGSGARLPSKAIPQDYETSLRSYLLRIPQADADVLRHLTVGSRDSDGDGLSDEVENMLGLDPFKQDSKKTGASDLEQFLGAKPDTLGIPEWPMLPPVSGVCSEGTTLWGRVDPKSDVGFFSQVGTGTRLQFAEATSDEGGFVLTGTTMAEVPEGASIVIRAEHAGDLVYSKGRSLIRTMCGRDALVVISAVRLEGNFRILDGKAAPKSLVFLHFDRALFVAMADENGDFSVLIPSSITSSVVQLETWVVQGGIAGPLQTYTMTMPLLRESAAEDRVLGLESTDEGQPWFWWLYVLGLFTGLASLGALGYFFIQSSKGDATDNTHA